MASKTFSPAPASEQELLEKAEGLAGKTFAEVASELGLTVPADQNHHKGWTGEIAERYLGATASSLAEPDFQLIGVELKTLPLTSRNNPKESTYVCTVNLTDITGALWETSVVRKKLSRVLWLPVEAEKTLSFPGRRFGSAFLWSPRPEQEAVLKNDWEEIMEFIATGELDSVSSSLGQYLQIRPKAANAAALGKSYSREGLAVSTLPRGFYLRSSFTRSILKEYLQGLGAGD